MRKKIISIIVVMLLIISSGIVYFYFVKENRTFSANVNSISATNVANTKFEEIKNIDGTEKNTKEKYKLEDKNSYLNNESIKQNTNNKNIELISNINNAKAIVNGETAYTIKHYKMKTDGKTYADPEIEVETGTANTYVTPKVKEYAGFSAPKTQSVKIEADGSTVVEYRYERNKYKLELTANAGIEKVEGAGEYYYGKIVSISAQAAKGYSFSYWLDYQGRMWTDREAYIKIADRDMAFSANAKPDKNVPYKVEHYKMNVDGTTDSKPFATEDKIGRTDELVTPEVKIYKGFTSPEPQTVKVNSDGSTVIKYYYTRNKYKLELIAGAGIEEVNGTGEYYYEQEVEISAKPAYGYKFDKWVYDTGRTCADTTTKVAIGTRNVMMVANAKINPNMPYTIKHYKMKLDGKTYEDPEIETRTGKTFSTVTAPVKNYEGFTAPEVQEVTISLDGKAEVKYYYKRNKYKLEVKANTGIAETTGTGEYYYEAEIPIDAKAEKGYEFDYWKDDSGKTIKEKNAKIKIGAKDTTVTAYSKLSENTPYTIKYYKMKLDGTTYADPEIEIKTGKTLSTVTAPVKKYDGFTAPEAQKVTITADGKAEVKYYYKRNKYKLEVKANIGISETTGTGEYYYEAEVPIDAKAEKGYEFDYWKDDSGKTIKEKNTKIKIGAKNATVTAYSKASENTKYTILHYKMNIDGTYANPETETKTGKTLSTVTAPVKKYDGFTSPETQKVTITADGKAEVKYYYKRNKYKLTLKKGEGISEVTGTGEYYYEAEASINATPTNGYTFDCWKYDDGKTVKEKNAKIKIVAKDMTLTANAKQNGPGQYIIEHYKNIPGGNQYFVFETEVKTGIIGTTVKPETKNYEGFTAPKAKEITIGGDGKTVVKYYYTRNKYAVNLVANKGIEKVYGAGEYYYETEIPISAKVSKGYRFDCWKDDKGNTENNIDGRVRIGADDATITANAKAISYKIEYDLDGGTVATPNKTAYTIETESFKLNEPTKKGYTFKEWVFENGKVLENGTIKKGTTGNIKLKATYEKYIPKAPQIKYLSFDVTDDNGKLRDDIVSVGDKAFYIKIPGSGKININTLKIATDIPITLNSKAQAGAAINGVTYKDLKPDNVSENGMSGEVYFSYSMKLSTKIKSTDGITWTNAGEKDFTVNTSLFKTMFTSVGKQLAIAKGFGISEDGLETPRYISNVIYVGDDSYMLFKEEGLPDINIKFLNGEQEIKKLTIPKGSTIPNIGPNVVVNKEFVNWCSDKELKNVADFNKPVYEDTVLYAKYTDYKIDTSWYDGHEDDKSYNISTLEQLRGVSELATNKKVNFKDKTINLANDIDLKNENWSPISGFSGTFNGNGHTISNLKIKENAQKGNIGFFSYVNEAKISNLRFDTVNIDTTKGNCMGVGTVCGESRASTLEKILVKNISISSRTETGGIVGVDYNGTISECETIDGKITNQKNKGTSGILGKGNNTTSLTNIYSNLDITANCSSFVCNVAGIIGDYDWSSRNGKERTVMKNLLYTGKITLIGDDDESAIKHSGIHGWCTGIGNTNKETWLFDSTKNEKANEGTKKTTEELKKAETYSGWDDKIWNIVEGQYPTLKIFN